MKAIKKYSKYSVVLLTESPNDSLYSWVGNKYQPDPKNPLVQNMVKPGIKKDDEWKSERAESENDRHHAKKVRTTFSQFFCVPKSPWASLTQLALLRILGDKKCTYVYTPLQNDLWRKWIEV